MGGGVDKGLHRRRHRLCRSHSQVIQHQFGHRVRPGGVVHRRGRRALRDRAAEQAGRGRGGEQCSDDPAAGRFAEQCHLLRVAAERRDVLLHPLQGPQHVAESEVGVEPPVTRVEPAQFQEAERTHPVVQGDDDRAAAVPGVRGTGHQRPGVIQRLTPRAEDVGAAVHPHQDRQPGAGHTARWSPYVEEQAVLRCPGAGTHRYRALGLRAHRAVTGCVGHLGPRLGPHRRPPAKLTRRRGRIADPLPSAHAPVVDAPDRSGVGVDDGVAGRATRCARRTR